jgi:hypothetical protein
MLQRAHLQAAAARAVGLADVGLGADDLATPRVVGAGQQREQIVVGQLVVPQQRDGGRGDLAQVVARHLGGQTHGNARCTVEQHERQPRRQLLRLFGRAVVVRDEVDGTLVDLVEQQPRDRRQSRLGVAHRRRPVAVTRAEIALAVDQRVAQREVLRHAHHRVVGRGVAMRVVAAEHIADHPRALDRLGPARRGTEGQPHALHRIEDAALHRLLAVTDVRQRAAFDDRQRVFEVGPLGIVREGDRVVVGGRRGFRCEEIESHVGMGGPGCGREGAQFSERRAPAAAASMTSRQRRSVRRD